MSDKEKKIKDMDDAVNDIGYGLIQRRWSQLKQILEREAEKEKEKPKNSNEC